MNKENGVSALVIGGAGGIGSAFVKEITARGSFAAVYATSRQGEIPAIGNAQARSLDLGDEQGFSALAQEIKDKKQSLGLIIVSSGVLHIDDKGPEKSMRSLDPAFLRRVYEINTIGPALCLKHFVPLMPKKGRAVFAALSARVGSISDNRLGGWYSYRASKAALNMVIKTASLEVARTRPDALCVGLHPGTVDTDLSKPFQRGVPEGKLFTPQYAASSMMAVLDTLKPEQSGKCFAFDGSEIPA